MLLSKCLDEKDMHTRHGAVLGVTEITLALSETEQLAFLSKESRELRTGLVPVIEKKWLLDKICSSQQDTFLVLHKTEVLLNQNIIC
jgi:hypothetical protein